MEFTMTKPAVPGAEASEDGLLIVAARPFFISSDTSFKLCVSRARCIFDVISGVPRTMPAS